MARGQLMRKCKQIAQTTKEKVTAQGQAFKRRASAQSQTLKTKMTQRLKRKLSMSKEKEQELLSSPMKKIRLDEARNPEPVVDDSSRIVWNSSVQRLAGEQSEPAAISPCTVAFASSPGNFISDDGFHADEADINADDDDDDANAAALNVEYQNIYMANAAEDDSQDDQEAINATLQSQLVREIASKNTVYANLKQAEDLNQQLRRALFKEKQKNEQLQQARSTSRTTHDALQKDNSALKMQLDELRTRSDQSEQELERKTISFQEEIEMMKLDCADLQKQNDRYSSDRPLYLTQLERFQRKIVDLEEAYRIRDLAASGLLSDCIYIQQQWEKRNAEAVSLEEILVQKNNALEAEHNYILDLARILRKKERCIAALNRRILKAEADAGLFVNRYGREPDEDENYDSDESADDDDGNRQESDPGSPDLDNDGLDIRGNNNDRNLNSHQVHSNARDNNVNNTAAQPSKHATIAREPGYAEPKATLQPCPAETEKALEPNRQETEVPHRSEHAEPESEFPAWVNDLDSPFEKLIAQQDILHRRGVANDPPETQIAFVQHITTPKLGPLMFLKDLVAGAQGAVALYQDANGRRFVQKTQELESYMVWPAKPDYPLEAYISDLRGPHPNLVGLCDVVITPRPGHLTKAELYVEYCDGGDLHGVIFNLSQSGLQMREIVIWHIIKQLCSALIELHAVDEPDPAVQIRRTLVHRDIKPGNIFLGMSKFPHGYFPATILGDLGMADFEICNTQLPGTQGYEPPELHRAVQAGNIKTRILGTDSDIYSLGVTIHEMMVHRSGGEASFFPQTVGDIVSVWNGKVQYSPTLWSVVRYMLEPERHKRLSKDELPTVVQLAEESMKALLPAIKENLVRTPERPWPLNLGEPMLR